MPCMLQAVLWYSLGIRWRIAGSLCAEVKQRSTKVWCCGLLAVLDHARCPHSALILTCHWLASAG